MPPRLGTKFTVASAAAGTAALCYYQQLGNTGETGAVDGCVHLSKPSESAYLRKQARAAWRQPAGSVLAQCYAEPSPSVCTRLLDQGPQDADGDSITAHWESWVCQSHPTADHEESWQELCIQLSAAHQQEPIQQPPAFTLSQVLHPKLPAPCVAAHQPSSKLPSSPKRPSPASPSPATCLPCPPPSLSITMYPDAVEDAQCSSPQGGSPQCSCSSVTSSESVPDDISLVSTPCASDAAELSYEPEQQSSLDAQPTTSQVTTPITLVTPAPTAGGFARFKSLAFKTVSVASATLLGAALVTAAPAVAVGATAAAGAATAGAAATAAVVSTAAAVTAAGTGAAAVAATGGAAAAAAGIGASAATALGSALAAVPALSATKAAVQHWCGAVWSKAPAAEPKPVVLNQGLAGVLSRQAAATAAAAQQQMAAEQPAPSATPSPPSPTIPPSEPQQGTTLPASTPHPPHIQPTAQPTPPPSTPVLPPAEALTCASIAAPVQPPAPAPAPVQPPGLAPAPAPIHSAAAPIHSAAAPVHSAAAPIHSAAAPIHSAAAPIHSAAAPVHSAAAPVHSAAAPIHSAAAPVHSAAAAPSQVCVQPHCPPVPARDVTPTAPTAPASPVASQPASTQLLPCPSLDAFLVTECVVLQDTHDEQQACLYCPPSTLPELSSFQAPSAQDLDLEQDLVQSPRLEHNPLSRHLAASVYGSAHSLVQLSESAPSTQPPSPRHVSDLPPSPRHASDLPSSPRHVSDLPSSPRHASDLPPCFMQTPLSRSHSIASTESWGDAIVLPGPPVFWVNPLAPVDALVLQEGCGEGTRPTSPTPDSSWVAEGPRLPRCASFSSVTSSLCFHQDALPTVEHNNNVVFRNRVFDDTEHHTACPAPPPPPPPVKAQPVHAVNTTCTSPAQGQAAALTAQTQELDAPAAEPVQECAPQRLAVPATTQDATPCTPLCYLQPAPLQPALQVTVASVQDVTCATPQPAPVNPPAASYSPAVEVFADAAQTHVPSSSNRTGDTTCPKPPLPPPAQPPAHVLCVNPASTSVGQAVPALQSQPAPAGVPQQPAQVQAGVSKVSPPVKPATPPTSMASDFIKALQKKRDSLRASFNARTTPSTAPTCTTATATPDVSAAAPVSTSSTAPAATACASQDEAPVTDQAAKKPTISHWLKDCVRKNKPTTSPEPVPTPAPKAPPRLPSLKPTAKRPLDLPQEQVGTGSGAISSCVPEPGAAVHPSPTHVQMSKSGSSRRSSAYSEMDGASDLSSQSLDTRPDTLTAHSWRGSDPGEDCQLLRTLPPNPHHMPSCTAQAPRSPVITSPAPETEQQVRATAVVSPPDAAPQMTPVARVPTARSSSVHPAATSSAHPSARDQAAPVTRRRRPATRTSSSPPDEARLASARLLAEELLTQVKLHARRSAAAQADEAVQQAGAAQPCASRVSRASRAAQQRPAPLTGPEWQQRALRQQPSQAATAGSHNLHGFVVAHEELLTDLPVPCEPPPNPYGLPLHAIQQAQLMESSAGGGQPGLNTFALPEALLAQLFSQHEQARASRHQLAAHQDSPTQQVLAAHQQEAGRSTSGVQAGSGSSSEPYLHTRSAPVLDAAPVLKAHTSTRHTRSHALPESILAFLQQHMEHCDDDDDDVEQEGGAGVSSFTLPEFALAQLAEWMEETGLEEEVERALHEPIAEESGSQDARAAVRSAITTWALALDCDMSDSGDEDDDDDDVAEDEQQQHWPGFRRSMSVPGVEDCAAAADRMAMPCLSFNAMASAADETAARPSFRSFARSHSCAQPDRSDTYQLTCQPFASTRLRSPREVQPVHSVITASRGIRMRSHSMRQQSTPLPTADEIESQNLHTLDAAIRSLKPVNSSTLPLSLQLSPGSPASSSGPLEPWPEAACEDQAALDIMSLPGSCNWAWDSASQDGECGGGSMGQPSCSIAQSTSCCSDLEDEDTLEAMVQLTSAADMGRQRRKRRPSAACLTPGTIKHLVARFESKAGSKSSKVVAV